MTTKILKYILVAGVVFILVGLAWWYVFLKSEQETLRALDAGRGANTPAPSFGSFIGSTYENLVSNFASEGSSEKNENGLSRLRRITQSPIAGYGFMPGGTASPTSASTSTIFSRIRFVERATGYVFEARTDSSELTRVTNTLVPKVYEAYVGESGVVIVRGLSGDTLATSVGVATTTPGSTEPKPLTLTALSPNIGSLALQPAGEKMVYVRDLPDGGFALLRAPWNNKSPEVLLPLGLRGWRVHYLADNRIFLVQNPADSAESTAYEVASGRLIPVVQNARGLSILPQDNSEAMLYSSENGLLSVQLKRDATPVLLPIRTFADKCAWAKAPSVTVYCAVPRTLVTSIESGLKGESHSTDTWWKIEANTGSGTLLYASEESLEAEEVRTTPDGAYIVFMNGVDKSLWSLRIEE